MELTEANVTRVFNECTRDKGPATLGIRMKAILNTEGHEDDITSMLDQLPSSFKRNGGGGSSFLMACQTDDGHQWAEGHNVVEALIMLGLAAQKASFALPRAQWYLHESNAPYIVIDTEGSGFKPIAPPITAVAMTDGTEVFPSGIGSNPREALTNLEFVGHPVLDEAASTLKAIPVTVSLKGGVTNGLKPLAEGFAVIAGDKIYANSVSESAGEAARAADAIEMEPWERGVYEILEVIITEAQEAA